MAVETVAELAAYLGLKLDQRAWSIGDRAINNLKNKLADFGTWVRGARWLEGMIGDVVDLGDHLDEMAQKTGVSVEDLQEFGYAAKQSGVGLDAVGAALGKVSRAAAAGAKGGKDQAKAFRDIGLSAKDVATGVTPLSAVLSHAADKLAGMPAGVEKNNLAMTLFGRAGRDLIPVLNNGSARLAELRQEFKDTGAEIDGPTAAAFGNLNDQKDLLATGWQGIKTQLATALLPTLLEIVKGFITWFKQNRLLIKQGIAGFAKVLAGALKAVAFAAGLVLKVFAFLAENWDVAKYAIYGLVAALAVYEAASIAAGVASAISWLVGLWPLGLLLLAIGLVALAVEDFYTYLEGGDSVFGRLVDAAKQYLGIDLTGVIGDTVDTAIFLFNTWWQSVKLIFGFIKTEFNIMKTLVEGIWKIIKPIVEAIESAAEKAASVASGFGLFDVDNQMKFKNTGSNLRYQGPLGRANRIVDHATGGLAGALASRPAASRPFTGGAGAGGAAPQVHMAVNITTGSGDPEEIARHVVHHGMKMWDEKLRDVATGEE